MINNMFYFYNINSIGGVEQFFYEIAKKYYNYDIVVYYTTGDKKQIERLKKYIDVRQHDGTEHIKCHKAFFNYNANILDCVEADEYYMIIHADYKTMNIAPPQLNKPFKFIGVSQLACEAFEEISGCPCQLSYNPITLDKPKRILKLISATRLTKEKGLERMKALIKILDENNIPFIWDIYTNKSDAINHPNVHYHQPTLDVNDYIADADYVVQLSDCEGWCYTMIQSLMIGIPIIVCDWPVLKELKIDNRYGFILPFDMNDIPVQEIYRKRFNFTYTPPGDNWMNILEPGPSAYQKAKNLLYKVKATRAYKDLDLIDMQLGYIPKRGEEFTISYERYTLLNNPKNNKYNKQFVELIKEISKEKEVI